MFLLFIMNRKDPLKSIQSLKKWVDSNGRVDYQSIKNDAWFQEQITTIKNADISNYSYNEEFAFWLNTYNLLTIEGVRIELKRKSNWKGNLTLLSKFKFFILRKFKVGKRKLSLNYIEHKILRKKFKDPRIHFVINCGSVSCPFLPNQLISPDKIDKTLDGLTSFFINSGNVIFDNQTNELLISKIFKWYKRDFNRNGGVLQFILRYWKKETFSTDIEKIKYAKYNWNLNSQ